jgi:hypothetical protein
MATAIKKKDMNLFVTPEGHPRDRIVIHESPEVPREGIFIALNGYSFLAKAGVPIDLPRPVREMLDTRIKTETQMVDDGNGHMISHIRNMPRMTYSIVQLDVNAMPEVVQSEEPALSA